MSHCLSASAVIVKMCCVLDAGFEVPVPLLEMHRSKMEPKVVQCTGYGDENVLDASCAMRIFTVKKETEVGFTYSCRVFRQCQH